jgi:sialate O-acetylesterase
MTRLRSLVFPIFVLVFPCISRASTLVMPVPFTSEMVLQQQMPDPVWGHADAGAAVTVTFAGQEKHATADAAGNWMVKLDPMPANDKGQEMTITSGDQTVKLTDVLVGEVWLCSGQSNMEKPIGEQRGQKPTENYQQEIAAADHPLIRLLTIPKVKSADAIKTNWEVCSPATVAKEHFSAVAYFFGRKIQQDVNVPVGLIHSSWGGTRIEPWTSPEGFQMEPTLGSFTRPVAPTTSTTRPTPPVPSQLYTAMIKPLVPFGIRGALWYQGESNVGDKDRQLYGDKMRALIGGWRKVWGEGDFPFYYVQLAPYQSGNHKGPPGTALAEMWDIQRKALSIPNTGMAVITDLVGDIHDIHPIRKREVAERLALWAEAKDYGKKDIEFSGPLFKSVDFSGDRAIVHFDHAAGLKTRDGKAPDYFEIAGADGKFVPATATIDGDAVDLSAQGIASPAAVRFGWLETAEPNLINGAGLPASPFKSN